MKRVGLIGGLGPASTVDYYNDIIAGYSAKFGADSMKNGLFQKAFSARGLGCVTPSDNDIEALGEIIYPNLENGIVVPSDKIKMVEIVEREIRENGCDAVLLGCTEIPLMIKDGDLSKPIINSTRVHVEKILSEIINE